jgi:hypothetical protein
MYSEDEENDNSAAEEVGSDELLAADELRLPESANILVRLHALRAWLDRRHAETELEIGMAALDLQEITQEAESEPRPRRRLSSENDFRVQRAQRHLVTAQQRLSAYDEARALLEDCVTHTTTGERLLVEYYLSLEELVQAANAPADAPWQEVMADVLHRVEQVGTPGKEEE